MNYKDDVSYSLKLLKVRDKLCSNDDSTMPKSKFGGITILRQLGI